MTFFVAASLLNISINVLLLIFVFICFLMTLVILMQRPKQEGLGAAFGGGVTDQVFGARTTNVLQRGTVYLGSLFFILSLILSVLIGQKNKTVKTVQAKDLVPKVEAAAPAVPAADAAPKSLSEELPVEDAAPAGTVTPAPDDVPADAPDASKPAAPIETAPPANAVVPPATEPAPTETPAPPAPAEGAPADPTKGQ